LDHKKIGPFKIEDKIGEVNYRLKLPKHMRINPVFHISLLEPAPRNAPTVAPDLSNENELIEYEVQEIIDQSERENGQQLYRVRWKGYGEQDDTWETEENLQNAKLLLKRFQKRKETRKDRKDQREAETQEEPRRPTR
jgi:uncharacterized protein (DUF608 family)